MAGRPGVARDFGLLAVPVDRYGRRVRTRSIMASQDVEIRRHLDHRQWSSRLCWRVAENVVKAGYAPGLITIRAISGQMAGVTGS
jgi:hypothetical protein